MTKKGHQKCWRTNRNFLVKNVLGKFCLKFFSEIGGMLHRLNWMYAPAECIPSAISTRLC